MVEAKIKKSKLNVNYCENFVSSEKAGAVNIFIGTVRNKTHGKSVKYLFYESYGKMAILEIEKIANYAQKKWQLENVVIHHRVGKVRLGEITVVIAVSSSHRKESFEGCRYIIDTLKKTVPIWKKEVYEGGDEWTYPNP